MSTPPSAGHRSQPEHPVLVVGDVVTDILAVHGGSLAVGSDTAASISIAGGGSAANTAAWLASVGVAVDLVGVAGMDKAGDDRVAELEAAGVGCAYLRRTRDAPTGAVIVLIHEAERSMLCDRGANVLLAPSDVEDALDAASGAAHVHLSGYTLLDGGSRAAGRHALAAAARRGLKTSVDAASAAPLGRAGAAAFATWIRGIDLLLANLDEARVLLGIDAEPVELARGLTGIAHRAVVKLGSRGAVLAGADGVSLLVPAYPAEVVDPTGAGDAFAAGLLASWLAGESSEESLRAGTRLGAMAVGTVGGRPP